MGLLERILVWVFGPKKGAREVDFGQAAQLVREELSAQEGHLVSFASLKFSEIRHLVSRLSAGAEYLKAQKIDLEGGNEAFRRIVSTSQKNLSRQLSGLSQKLAPPSSITPQSVRDYYSKAMPSIANDLMPYWKNVALAKLLLKDEVKEIGENLKELALTIESIGAKLHDKAPQGLSGLGAILGNISESDANAEDLAAKVTLAKNEAEAAKQEALSIGKSLQSKMASPQARRLGEIAAQISGLESKKLEVVSCLNSSLAPLEKALKRLRSVAESGVALSAREREVLSLMLENPAGLIISDPKGEVAKAVLSKARDMILSGSISLKDSERQKRLGSIAALLEKDFFSEYFWELNKLQSELAQAQKESSSLTVNAEISSEKAALESAKSRLASYASIQERLGRELAAREDEGKKMRQQFASLFNSIFEGRYSIRYSIAAGWMPPPKIH